jgi:hypothetical protein
MRPGMIVPSGRAGALPTQGPRRIMTGSNWPIRHVSVVAGVLLTLAIPSSAQAKPSDKPQTGVTVSITTSCSPFSPASAPSVKPNRCSVSTSFLSLLTLAIPSSAQAKPSDKPQTEQNGSPGGSADKDQKAEKSAILSLSMGLNW